MMIVKILSFSLIAFLVFISLVNTASAHGPDYEVDVLSGLRPEVENNSESVTLTCRWHPETGCWAMKMPKPIIYPPIDSTSLDMVLKNHRSLNPSPMNPSPNWGPWAVFAAFRYEGEKPLTIEIMDWSHNTKCSSVQAVIKDGTVIVATIEYLHTDPVSSVASGSITGSINSNTALEDTCGTKRHLHQQIHGPNMQDERDGDGQLREEAVQTDRFGAHAPDDAWERVGVCDHLPEFEHADLRAWNVGDDHGA